MNAGTFAIAALLAVAAAQPHGQQHHRRYHKRDVVTDIVTVVETAPVAVVMVDQWGDVLYTTHAQSSSTATPAPTPSPTPVKQAAAPVSQAQAPAQKPKAKSSRKHTHKHTSTKQVSATPTQTKQEPTTTPSTTYHAASQTPSSSSTSEGTQSGFGISYAPYNSDGTCRSASEVMSDFNDLKNFGYVRSYGVDCDQVPSMMQAAKANDMKVMLGVYDIAQCSSELDTMIAAVEANGGWDLVQAVSIGNEDVNAGRATVSAVVNATNSGRTQLRSAGYQGPVVHVDVFNQILLNPELCECSDFVAANCHAFFDPNTSADGAGAFVLNQVQQMKQKCGGKQVTITESGWPNNGDANGKAVPNAVNQQLALDSIKSKFTSNIVFFSAYNDLWKKDNAYTFGAEHYWGMFGAGTSVVGF